MNRIICFFFCILMLCPTDHASAHFGMVIPSTPVVSQRTPALSLSLSFSHPFLGQGMNLSRPVSFFMYSQSSRINLTDKLQQKSLMGHKAWQAEVSIKRPGLYWFVMEPRPYWDAAEDIFIIHYTKTVVPAFGADDDWDVPLGLTTEIIPLTRPFGNYQGNSFSGQVLLYGQPAANSTVEVEYYNKNHSIKAPTPYHTTQVIKADANGTFTFTCPFKGWWGFAALNTAENPLQGPDGKDKEVEIAAVMWIYFDDFQSQ